MSKPVSDKKVVKILADVCVASGLRHAVISPGSRNAPLTITFVATPEITCYSVVDERSAGFFALGMAQQLNEPVALVCTSGSALLNYAPAVAEAFYQGIPLVVISADRPVEWIDQADGQTIRQDGVLDDYVKFSASLPASMHLPEEEWYVNRLLNELLFHCRYRNPGPVHLNVPLREPLYGKTVHSMKPQRIVQTMHTDFSISQTNRLQLMQEWNKSDRVLILVGQQQANKALGELLNQLAGFDKVVVLSETLSNLNLSEGFYCIDRLVSTITDDEVPFFQPTLLVTFDGAIVSKMVKSFLRNNPPQIHWHISPAQHHLDTYMHLTRWIESDALSFFRQMQFKNGKSLYRQTWQKRAARNRLHHQAYLDKMGWSDMTAYSLILKYLPDNVQIQVANSAPVRYLQLFEEYHTFEMYCNRGTSGIDGSVSTAVGAAVAYERSVVLITGDLSFLYDSNGLWNNYLPASFRVVVVNNGGGGIFRFISGPTDTEELEMYFEAAHQIQLQPVAQLFGLGYRLATDSASLEVALADFFKPSDGPQILEIATPSKENAKILKSYFKQLNELL